MAIYACKGCVAPKEQHDKDKAIQDQKKYIADGLNSQAMSGIYKAQMNARRISGKTHGK